MGQILKPDNIPNIVKASTTTVTLAATNAGQSVRVTIGGQQYSPSATLSLSTAASGAGGLDTGLIAANSTYYVYTVLSGGNLALIASLAVPSTGPIGFTTANKAIGLFATTSVSTSVDYAAGINPTQPGISADGAGTITGTTTFTQPIVGITSNNERRNHIINGNVDFNQRLVLTSNSVTASTRIYGGDRFYWFHNISNNPTSQTVADVPTVAQSGFGSIYSIKLTNNATPSTPSAAQVLRLIYRMEGYDYSSIHGSAYRHQFWVKTSVAGIYSVSFQNYNLTRSYVTTYTVSGGEINTWVKKSIDVPYENTGTWLFETSVGLQINYVLASGTDAQTATINQWQSADKLFASTGINWAGTASATFQIAQVALYPGNYATNVDLPFSRYGKHISEEIAMCQRYYQKCHPLDIHPTATAPSDYRNWHNSGNDVSGAGGSMWNSRALFVPMRAAPTMTVFSSSGSSGFVDGYTLGNPSYGGVGAWAAGIDATSTKYVLNCAKNGHSSMTWFWTADADL